MCQLNLKVKTLGDIKVFMLVEKEAGLVIGVLGAVPVVLLT